MRSILNLRNKAGADLEFSMEGEDPRGEGGTLAYDFVKISTEKHEIEISNFCLNLGEKMKSVKIVSCILGQSK